MIPSFEDLKKHNNYIFLVLVLILSNIQLYSTFNYLEANPPCCDSIAYFDISETYREQSLFEEHEYSKKRTYLFPLVIALIPRFARVDYYGFMLNYYIFTSIIFSFLVVIFYYYLKKTPHFFVLSLSLFLNPILLTYIPHILTESLTLLLFFSICFLVFSKQKDIFYKLPYFFFLGFLSGISMITRPANIAILAAAMVFLSYPFITSLINKNTEWKEVKYVKLLLLFLVGFILPFIPQIIINWKIYGVISITTARPLGINQIVWGAENLKYATFFNGNFVRQIFFPTSEFFTALNGYEKHPVYYFFENPGSGILLFIIHIYNSLNVDFLYTYINHKYEYISWHQILSSITIFMGSIYIILFYKKILLRASDFFLFLILLFTLSLNGIVAVETRFGMIPLAILSYFTVLMFFEVIHFKKLLALLFCATLLAWIVISMNLSEHMISFASVNRIK